jgi:sulfatase maturation enzyme AslB (radical SAM superfamily)
MHCKLIKQGLVIHTDGVATPCCQFNKMLGIPFTNLKEYFQSQFVSNLTTVVDSGEFPPGCENCKTLHPTGRDWMSAQNTLLNDDDFLFELRNSNLCNYSCLTCSPESSSKIAAEYKKLNFGNHTMAITVIPEASIQEAIDKSTRISFLGGEPLYDKKVIQYISTLADKKEISITTNGSILPDTIFELKNVLISFSVDALYDQNEYIRHGSNWNTVDSNIKKCLNSGIKTQVAITISLYNVFSLDKTIAYFLDLGVHHIELNFVHSPDFMSIFNLHPQEKNNIIAVVKKCFALSKFSPYLLYTLKTLLTMVSTSYTDEKWIKFAKYTSMLDNSRGTDVKTAIPELAKYF